MRRTRKFPARHCAATDDLPLIAQSGSLATVVHPPNTQKNAKVQNFKDVKSDLRPFLALFGVFHHFTSQKFTQAAKTSSSGELPANARRISSLEIFGSRKPLRDKNKPRVCLGVG